MRSMQHGVSVLTRSEVHDQAGTVRAVCVDSELEKMLDLTKKCK